MLEATSALVSLLKQFDSGGYLASVDPETPPRLMLNPVEGISVKDEDNWG